MSCTLYWESTSLLFSCMIICYVYIMCTLCCVWIKRTMAEVSTRLCAQFICHEMIKYVWKYIGHSQHTLSVLVRTLLAILLCLFPFSQLFVATCSPARDSGAGYIAWGHSTLVGPVSIIWKAVYCVYVLDSLWEDWRILMSLWNHDVSIYQILHLLHILYWIILHWLSSFSNW